PTGKRHPPVQGDGQGADAVLVPTEDRVRAEAAEGGPQGAGQVGVLGLAAVVAVETVGLQGQEGPKLALIVGLRQVYLEGEGARQGDVAQTLRLALGLLRLAPRLV